MKTSCAGEDMAFCQAIKKIGRFVVPEPAVVTSARKLSVVSPWEVISLLVMILIRGPRYESNWIVDILYGPRAEASRKSADPSSAGGCHSPRALVRLRPLARHGRFRKLVEPCGFSPPSLVAKINFCEYLHYMLHSTALWLRSRFVANQGVIPAGVVALSCCARRPNCRILLSAPEHRESDTMISDHSRNAIPPRGNLALLANPKRRHRHRSDTAHVSDHYAKFTPRFSHPRGSRRLDLPRANASTSAAHTTSKSPSA